MTIDWQEQQQHTLLFSKYYELMGVKKKKSEKASAT